MVGWEGLRAEEVVRFDPHLSFRPVVSVVIMARGDPVFSGEAEASVRAQTLWASGTVEIVTKSCPTYWGHKLNDAIRGASGQYVAILCDDDLLEPTFLERCVHALADPTVDMVYTDHWLFGLPTSPPDPIRMEAFSLAAINGRCIPWMTHCAKRELFARIPYDPTMQYLDWERSRSLVKADPPIHAVWIPEPLWKAREHAANGHKQMDHGHAYAMMRYKHLFTDPPVAPLAPVVYPPWYDGRPSTLTEADCGCV